MIILAANFSEMNRAILNYIDSKIPKDTNQAHIGIVNGNRVVINNKTYSYTPTVDMFFTDGYRVACLLPENSNTAAVVGVY